MQFPLFHGPLRSLKSTITSGVIIFAGLFATLEIGDRAQAYVVSGDPNDYIVSPGNGFDGVVSLFLQKSLGGFDCSGSLLSSGRHILTAAHCLTDDFGFNITNAATAFFDLPTGKFGINIANIFIYPDWDGFADFDSFGGDVAILELVSAAPEAAQRYDIYRNTDEIGQVSTKVGYGLSGQGNQGYNPGNFPFGVKRSGQNVYEFLGENLDPGVLPSAILLYDFDNGLPENDAFGFVGIPNLGLGLSEVSTAPGDSGGPTFINGLIAGITSYGQCFVNPINFECVSPPDVDNIGNSSFGEFSGDTRVSTYASYIDDVLAGKITPTSRVPEPNTIFALFTFAALAVSSRLKKKLK
ncbi:trypsin-like serine protease [Phormidium sp. LEGE 05292]|uniref:trypsin-like serine protease n=1 Tax=[Phormidium] sp. LEGE 05292 TaxID=767427 RepID=UPI0018820D0B|nr:trypsin-like serine protease [Phormidium sp. LEGE 05292]MBE9228091.1 trypsin-like serine protease [Phormidium sp. LEGE 05292]